MAANLKNLRTPTTEQAREIGRKGGLASAQKRKERKAMRETLQILLDLSIRTGKKANIEKSKSIRDLSSENVSVQEAILMKQIEKALKGDLKALEFLRDTLGERPTDNINLTTNGTTEAIMEKLNERSNSFDEDTANNN